MNKETELQQVITDLQTQLAKAITQLENLNKPSNGFEVGQKCYFIGSYGDIGSFMWDNDESDLELLAMGNAFHTEAEAIKARDKQLALVRVQNTIKELDGGEVVDWNNDFQKKYVIYYDHGKACYSCYVALQSQHDMFSANNLSTLEYIIENMEADLKLIWGIV